MSECLAGEKEKILKSEALLVATDCPGSLFQLRANLEKENHPFNIFHMSELYAKVTGKISSEYT